MWDIQWNPRVKYPMLRRLWNQILDWGRDKDQTYKFYICSKFAQPGADFKEWCIQAPDCRLWEACSVLRGVHTREVLEFAPNWVDKLGYISMAIRSLNSGGMPIRILCGWLLCVRKEIGPWTSAMSRYFFFQVRGTVRSLENEQKVAPLRKLCADENVLQLVEAELTDHNSWIEAARGTYPRTRRNRTWDGQDAIAHGMHPSFWHGIHFG